jgi:hypothetical protein
MARKFIVTFVYCLLAAAVFTGYGVALAPLVTFA